VRDNSGVTLRKRPFAAVFTQFILVVSVACQPGKPVHEGIPVGFYGALTGSTATFGQSGKNGVSLAFDEINARGGVLGDRLVLRVEDDRGEPAEAASAVTKLVSRDHAVALIGEAASSRTLAAAPIAQADEIPMVTPSSTNPQVTRVGTYIFRMCFTDDFQGEMLARFAETSLHARSASFLVDSKSDYSIGLAAAFRKAFTRGGGVVRDEQRYSEGDTDFSAQLTQIRTSSPDVLFVPGYYTEVGLIARQKKSLAVGGVLLGGDGWDSPRLTEIAGEAANGAYFSNHYSPEDPSPATARFVSAYRARYHQVPDSVAALSYDAGRLVADAIRRAGEASGPRIREALAQTRDFSGVTGNLSFDLERNPVKSITMLRIENVHYRFVEKISPDSYFRLSINSSNPRLEGPSERRPAAPAAGFGSFTSNAFFPETSTATVPPESSTSIVRQSGSLDSTVSEASVRRTPLRISTSDTLDFSKSHRAPRKFFGSRNRTTRPPRQGFCGLCRFTETVALPSRKFLASVERANRNCPRAPVRIA